MTTPTSPLVHLIDDDGAVREALALLIGTVGLRVQTWADPQAFVEAFDRDGIGAIVVDVRMPGISGLTVLDTLFECLTVWLSPILCFTTEEVLLSRDPETKTSVKTAWRPRFLRLDWGTCACKNS